MTPVEQKAFEQMREALELAMDNLRPHGDNCFLHDEGEYNACFCGKDSLVDHLQSVVESADLTAANAVQQRETNKAVGAALSHAFKNFEAIAKGEIGFAVPADAVAIAENGQVSWLQGKTLFGTHYLYAANAVSDTGNPITPSSQKTIAFALEGMELHDFNAPEYIISAELIRLNKALSGQASEPAGWKLVPVEPTPEMLDAALNEVLRIASELDDEASHSEIYQAMLAAAPEAP